MESTTIATPGTARAAEGYPMDARLRVPAPTHLLDRKTTVVTGSTDFAGRAALVPAYRATDVHGSVTGRPPV